MRVLLASLRQFCQGRRFWAVYLFWGFLIYMAFQLVRSGDTAFLILVITALPGAWIVGTLQEEVSAKAFSFCLPGYQRTVRRLVLLIGMALCAVGGLCFALDFRLPDVSAGMFPLIMFLGFCFTWCVYLTGIALTLTIGSTAMMGIANVVCAGAVVLGGRHPEINRLLFDHPFILISLALFTTAVWWWLERPTWFRKRCGKPVTGLLFPSDHSMRQLARKNVTALEIPEFPLALDRRLLSIIRSPQRSAAVKSVAGIVYTTVAPLLLWATKSRGGALWVLSLFFCVLAAGYMPELGLFIIWMIVLVLASGIEDETPMFSEMLIYGGRRERFYATASFVAISAGLLAAIFILPVLVLNLLTPWLPDVHIGGSTLTFHRISLGMPMLLMIVIPGASLLEFWLHGRRGGQTILLAVPGGAVMLLLYVSFRFDHIPAIPFSTLALAAILAWLVFVIGIRWIAMRSDLVRR